MLNSINFIGIKRIISRLKRTDSNLKQNSQKIRDQVHKRYRTNILFAFTLLALGITFCFCWQIIANPESNPDTIKSAFTLVTAIVSGLIGFVTGKAVG